MVPMFPLKWYAIFPFKGRHAFLICPNPTIEDELDMGLQDDPIALGSLHAVHASEVSPIELYRGLHPRAGRIYGGSPPLVRLRCSSGLVFQNHFFEIICSFWKFVENLPS